MHGQLSLQHKKMSVLETIEEETEVEEHIVLDESAHTCMLGAHNWHYWLLEYDVLLLTF
jgi:tellurite resistance-related uncharacterized protein